MLFVISAFFFLQEFKLNPNAKSFVPSKTPLRPASPAADGSFYYPTNVPGVQHLHNMPVGLGVRVSCTLWLLLPTFSPFWAFLFLFLHLVVLVCYRWQIVLILQIGPSFPAHQPVIFNPQAAHMQSPQPYFHPNGPQVYQCFVILSHGCLFFSVHFILLLHYKFFNN